MMTEIKQKNDNEKNLFVIVNRQTVTKRDVESMTPLQITELIGRIQMGISIFDEKIRGLKSHPVPSVYKDKINSLGYAKRMLRQSLAWITPIRKRKNMEVKVSEDEKFREVAHRMLDDETYRKILVRAQAELELKAENC